ncbi:hypothetical protein P7K49_013246 [Saguinus oedipus]|uniref:Uncharacterized protein n=1 Tax=Saguinus oedipus TaxID=9490 RepID=A0ABQ9VFY0_SAGOE|nr:hypothetical protein P7K49_013246 [Saguinus oedipus]
MQEGPGHCVVPEGLGLHGHLASCTQLHLLHLQGLGQPCSWACLYICGVAAPLAALAWLPTHLTYLAVPPGEAWRTVTFVFANVVEAGATVVTGARGTRVWLPWKQKAPSQVKGHSPPPLPSSPTSQSWGLFMRSRTAAGGEGVSGSPAQGWPVIPALPTTPGGHTDLTVPPVKWWGQVVSHSHPPHCPWGLHRSHIASP